ncbi:MAG: hypothetical protein HYY06_26910 [Deltaproteobacteria bacterium]|nr:hypothetical protein [Deltaproteobacteria bacterium]
MMLLGCPSSQTWTTARTVPAGSVQHTAGVEFIGLNVDDPDCVDAEGDDVCDSIGFVAVPFPGYIARIGVADMLDLGFKASTAGSFGADFKIQLVRTDAFDLAIDPGFSMPFVFAFTYINMPVLFSLNFGEMTTLTLYPKASYWVVFNEDIDTAANGFFVGGGANFQIRVSDRFAITPGFEWTRSVAGMDEGEAITFFNFGVGFSFGSFPEFGEPQVAQPTYVTPVQDTSAPPPPPPAVPVQ